MAQRGSRSVSSAMRLTGLASGPQTPFHVKPAEHCGRSPRPFLSRLWLAYYGKTSRQARSEQEVAELAAGRRRPDARRDA
jgi:hypothetical protein